MLKIAYFGSSNFSIQPLKFLLEKSKHKVSHIVTTTGSDNNIQHYAESNNIPIHYINSLAEEKQKNLIKNFDVDLFIVVSYGCIFPKDLLNCKQYGSFNIHPSDLPKFRGPSPIQNVILSHQKESAVCIIKMDEGVDTGDIIARSSFEISSDIYYSELENFCSKKGADLLLKVLDDIDCIKPIKQTNIGVSHTKKITKSDGIINFSNDILDVYAQIRAFEVWPSSYFTYKRDIIKILKADILSINHDYRYGQVINKNMHIACKGGILKPQLVHRSGKKPMLIKEFLIGFKIPEGHIL